MGLFGNIKGIGQRIYSNASLGPTGSEVKNYTLNTLKYVAKPIGKGLLDQIKVLPSVGYSLFFHAKTRMVAGHVLRISLEDLFLIVMVKYVNDTLQQQGQDTISETPDYPWLSTTTILQLSLSLLEMASMAYVLRKKLQMMVRTTVLTIGAVNGLNGVNGTHASALCVEKECSTLRFLQGSIRDTTAFYATEGAISLVSYVPVVGRPTAALLSIYHRGRYVLTLTLPTLCNRHQTEYLRQYAEFAFSLGLHHAIICFILLHIVEYVTGLPAKYYDLAVYQLMLFASISITAHISLAPAIDKSSRSLLDPLNIYQAIIGFIFDTLALGMKKQLPRLLKLPPSSSFHNLVIFMHLLAVHPLTQRASVFLMPLIQRATVCLLPRMLRSEQTFILDPVIAPYWNVLRQSLIQALESIEQIRKMPAVKAATLNPAVVAKTLWIIFGTPKVVVNVLLQLMGNDTNMVRLTQLRQKLERMEVYDEPLPPREVTLELSNANFKSIKTHVPMNEFHQESKTPNEPNLVENILFPKNNSNVTSILRNNTSSFFNDPVTLIRGRSTQPRSAEEVLFPN